GPVARHCRDQRLCRRLRWLAAGRCRMSATTLARDLVVAQTRALKLPGVARTFEALARQARDAHWPHEDYLHEVLTAEQASRRESRPPAPGGPGCARAHPTAAAPAARRRAHRRRGRIRAV